MADTKVSPVRTARIAGVWYLLTIVTGAFAAMLPNAQADLAFSLAATACYVAVTLLFYVLFRPVNSVLASIAAVFSLIGCALSALGTLHLISSPVNPLVFFGCYCLLIGYLIFRSTFLPRTLGVLMCLAGLGWLTFASPALADRLSPFNLAPGLIGEGSLTIWLLAVGVNAQRWADMG